MVTNVQQAESWFEVMQTGARVQSAVMRLEPGKASGEKAEAHPLSEQVVLEGEVEAEIGEKRFRLSRGDFIHIAPGVFHRIVNRSASTALTFNTYSPPEY
jgi:quercetin dioxygenase-like cupin family protein